MCRMIAAVGRFDMTVLAGALRAMAANENPAYEHEITSEGDAVLHDCGWGVAYRDGADLVRVRSQRSCLADPAFDAISSLRTDLVVLHARRNRDRNTIDVANSHPFVAEWSGRTWAFCHNGELGDTSVLDSDPRLVPEGSTDSELLFHHVLLGLDQAGSELSFARSLSSIDDFTCLNCFLATADRVVAHAGMQAGTARPRYYTLWLGAADGRSVVSSEPVSGVGVEWRRLPSGSTVELAA
jgi:predicted glutamine amidotransferase